jgi:REP element-mobilizing transposase RayT
VPEARQNAIRETRMPLHFFLSLYHPRINLPGMPVIHKRMGANLPHWTADGATYAVTFRLADSIPAAAVARMKLELEALEREIKRGAELEMQGQIRLARLREAKIDEYLDAGHGECLMRDPAVAEIVSVALQHFHRQRYELVAWCVMPNHVHVVFTPLPGHGLEKILHSWKSFTAKQINKHLGRAGGVWQPESYDHLVRNRADLMHHVFYARENPAKAGLQDWKWVG